MRDFFEVQDVVHVMVVSRFRICSARFLPIRRRADAGTRPRRHFNEPKRTFDSDVQWRAQFMANVEDQNLVLDLVIFFDR